MGLGNCVFIGDVIGKIDDYRICKKCESINWYENKRCASDGGCDSTKFKQWSYKKYREWYDEEVEWAMITEYESGNEDIKCVDEDTGELVDEHGYNWGSMALYKVFL